MCGIVGIWDKWDAPSRLSRPPLGGSCIVDRMISDCGATPAAVSLSDIPGYRSLTFRRQAINPCCPHAHVMWLC